MESRVWQVTSKSLTGINNIGSLFITIVNDLCCTTKYIQGICFVLLLIAWVTAYIV